MSTRIEIVEFDRKVIILFLERRLLYVNSYLDRSGMPLSSQFIKAIESFPPSHIPVEDNDFLWRRLTCVLADDGNLHPGILIESDDVDSVDDDTSISLPEFESFYVDYPNSGNSTH
ncbi:hypothetical protein Tco_1122796 [Tanacetum coccineum]|uniref:Uncharacterized protein n=1 Tax=Tanacetum coccineum TaxID=301880 RepID=A0ABQ5J2M9_9ASTR